jgi:hypothetical protein
MDEVAPLDPAPRRSRVGPLSLFVVLALVVGFALMWLSMREGADWWQRAPETAAAPAAPPAATAPATPAAALGPVDPVTLATRESALAGQLAALEARAAAVTTDITAAADRAGRAEAILIAFASRRSIERGTPLGYLEDQLRQRFGATQQQAVETVIQAGRDPVTIEALRQALDANASLLLNPGTHSWFAGLIDELRNLVVLHDVNTPSPLPSDRLARARRMLEVGQVEPALEEIGRLPGGAQAVNWTAAAQRYVDARRALDTLETAAIVGTIPSAALPAEPVVAPATAPAAEQPPAG